MRAAQSRLGSEDFLLLGSGTMQKRDCVAGDDDGRPRYVARTRLIPPVEPRWPGEDIPSMGIRAPKHNRR
jgi:hypothetical protein